MKKTIIIMMGFLAIMCFTSSVYAGTWAQASAGSEVTVVSGTPADYPTLTFRPSPGIIIEGVNTAIVYGIITASNKAGTAGIAYNLHSGDGVVYQDPITIVAGVNTTGLTPVAGVAVSTFSSK